jgi:hypothetical protein
MLDEQGKPKPALAAVARRRRPPTDAGQPTCTPSAALCSAAMSSFFIPSIAFIARSARVGSGSLKSSSRDGCLR